MLADLYPFTPRAFLHPAAAGAPAARQSYLDENPAAAPGRETLVMVHGNPTWSFFYRDLVKRLSRDWRVIAPDHVGMGLSDKPQDYPYRLAQHTANLARLLDAVLPEGKVTLIVHDWGGAIGLGWAVAHPERVAKLIIMNTAAFPFPRMPLRIRAGRIPGIGALAIRGLNAFARLATTMTTVRALPPAVKEGYLLPYGDWRDRVAILRFVQDIPMGPGHPSWETLRSTGERLAGLGAVPTLIQWGGKDWCFDDLIYQEWVRRFPKAECDYYGDAGHYLLEDKGEAIAERIERFLNAPVTGA